MLFNHQLLIRAEWGELCLQRRRGQPTLSLRVRCLLQLHFCHHKKLPSQCSETGCSLLWQVGVYQGFHKKNQVIMYLTKRRKYQQLARTKRMPTVTAAPIQDVNKKKMDLCVVAGNWLLLLARTFLYIFLQLYIISFPQKTFLLTIEMKLQ